MWKRSSDELMENYYNGANLSLVVISGGKNKLSANNHWCSNFFDSSHLLNWLFSFSLQGAKCDGVRKKRFYFCFFLFPPPEILTILCLYLPYRISCTEVSITQHGFLGLISMWADTGCGLSCNILKGIRQQLRPEQDRTFTQTRERPKYMLKAPGGVW